MRVRKQLKDLLMTRINIRVSDEQFLKLKLLRSKGLNISSTVRELIDQKFNELTDKRKSPSNNGVVKSD